MSYCMRCGKQTDNEDYVCDDCRQKEADTKVNAEKTEENGAQPPFAGQGNDAGRQGNYWAPPPQYGAPNANGYGVPPYNGYVPPYMPYAADPPVDRSKFPLNRCGLLGMIFSLAGLACWLGILILVVVFVGSNPEAFNDPYYQPPESELMAFGMGAFFLLVGAFAFAVTGVALSGVGLARYKRFRAVGFAIAGLVIGVMILLMTISVFGSIFTGV